jgi:large subunit ribosomal protein L28
MCDNCEKGIVHGRQSTHKRGVAGKRWKKRAQKTPRTFKPNLQKIEVTIGGVKSQMKLCTSCISRFIKDGKIKKAQPKAKKVASL